LATEAEDEKRRTTHGMASENDGEDAMRASDRAVPMRCSAPTEAT
jgi:hypothetical protein